MNNIYYFAAWTDSGFLLGCDHQHATVISATACISCAGGYPIAVEGGVLRALNDAEEREFQEALYGRIIRGLTLQDFLALSLGRLHSSIYTLLLGPFELRFDSSTVSLCLAV
jgi:hypothetical protein